MAGDGNYSFYKHNLRTPAMQSFNRSRLLGRRESSENKLGCPENSPTTEKPEQLIQGVKFTGFVPHPPSSPRSTGSSPRSNPGSPVLKGKKRSRYDSPKTSGSEDDRKLSKPALSSIRDPLPPLRRRGSSESIGSVESVGSGDVPFTGSPFGRRRGLEPLKDIGSDKELVGSFKSYQQTAKCDSPSSSNPLKPMKVNKDSDITPRDDTGEAERFPLHSTPIKPALQEPASVISNGTVAEDEDTLSCSDESLTSVSDSEDDALSDSEDEQLKRQSKKIAEVLSRRDPNSTLPSLPGGVVAESEGSGLCSSSSESEEGEDQRGSKKRTKASSRRDPNSTLPTLPADRKDDTIKSDASGLYDSLHHSKYPKMTDMQSSSTSDLQNLNRALAKVSTSDPRYVSDTELCQTYGSQFSQVSQSSLLPRVNARTVRMRTKNFLSEEMERYVPERCIGLFVATWNMHEEKVSNRLYIYIQVNRC